MKIRGFITHKQSETYNDCQDRFCINKDTKSIALSDGMSQSFLQQYWAEILCNYYVEDINWLPKDANLQKAKEEWSKKEQDFLKEQEKKKNPFLYLIKNKISNKESAGATFLGLRLDNKKLHYDVLGDSCLIKVKKKQIESLDDIISSQEGAFDSYPDFLDSSQQRDNKGVLKSNDLDFNEGDIFLMVSDPFSDFFYTKVKDGDCCQNLITQILQLQKHKDFQNLVNKWRLQGMHNDDSTLIIIEYDGIGEWDETFFNDIDDINKLMKECSESIQEITSNTINKDIEQNKIKRTSSDNSTNKSEEKQCRSDIKNDFEEKIREFNEKGLTYIEQLISLIKAVLLKKEYRNKKEKKELNRIIQRTNKKR